MFGRATIRLGIGPHSSSHYYKLLLGHHFQAERLPLSQGAAHYHALCVHLQVVEWESLGHISLEPCHLGWQRIEFSFQAKLMMQ